ncbi:MAG: VWA domain-containing protein [Phycisphaerae bacterium]
MTAVLLAAAGYSIFAALRTHLPWARWRVGWLLACRLLLLAGVAAWCLDFHLQYKSSAGKVEMVVIADHSESISKQGLSTVEDWKHKAESAMKGGWLKVVDMNGSSRSTPIAEAIDAARSSLPGKGEKRILLLSDGRATTRDPLALTGRLKNENIKVFAVPAEPLPGESLIADLIVPPAAWQNVPMPIEVLLYSSEAQKQQCKLTLTVDGKPPAAGGTMDVQLPHGTSSVEMAAAFDKEGVHSIEVKAEFQRSVYPWNKSASALVDVPLAPRVLIVSDPVEAARPLESILTANGILTIVRAPKDLPNQFACDCLVLANVPTEAFSDKPVARRPTTASSAPAPPPDPKIDLRLKAIEQFVRGGGSVIFTGGNKAFAAGGYVGSPLEPVFPVMLMPKKERPPYALAVVMDNSWSMNEGITSSVGKINIAKEIAIAAIEGLNKGDALTFVSFDSDYHNIINPTKVQDLEPLKYEVSKIGAFGMTNILGGMQEGARLLQTMDAPYKHLILISDGKETEVGTDYSRVLALLERDKVTLTAIGVGLGANDKLLNTLAFAGKGRYYHAKSVAEVPAAVLQEAKGLEDQLVVPIALQPRKNDPSDDPALAGIDIATMPKLGGYNRSRARTHAWTPLVISSKNEPLLARMRYGRGQSLAFMSTVAGPWSKEWIDQKMPEYTAFWRQAVLSVLGEPYHALEAGVEYDGGKPVFDLSASVTAAFAGEKGATTCELWRLDSGAKSKKPVTPGDLQVAAGDSDALLVTAKSRTNSAFAWSRTYGREFAEPSHGVETLKELCRATGGAFAADGTFGPNDGPFAPGRATVTAEIAPAAWLIVAAVLLVIELLLRRLPALTGLLRRK